MILLKLRFWLMVVVASVLWSQWEALRHSFQETLDASIPLPESLQDKVRPVVGYELTPDRWTAFPLIHNGHVVRVLSNLEADPDVQPPLSGRWSYALTYRLEDGDGTTTVEGIYHHDTRLTRFMLPETGTLQTPAFFRTGGKVLTDTRIFPLNAVGIKPPMTLYLRLAHGDPALGRLVARVSMHELVEEEKLSTLWQRLSRKTQEDIAGLTLYPADLLIPSEQRNLMREMWRPQGPRGIPGTDYQPVPFLAWEEGVENILEPFVLALGLPFGGYWTGIVPLAEAVRSVRLEMNRGEQAGVGTVPITMRWYGRLAHEREEYRREWNGIPLKLNLPKGGILALNSPEPLILRVFARLEGEDVEQEVTPKPMQASSWETELERPLRFFVLAGGAGYRITLRQLIVPGQDGLAEAASVTWRILAEGGKALATGKYGWCPKTSHFDRAGEDGVSEPVTFFLAAPEGGRVLELESEHPVWVAVANRPADLEHVIRVPEDAYAADNESLLPAWFSLRPEGWRDLQKTDRFRLIAVQPRPPEEAEPRFGWVGHEPENAHLGRYLLTPREENAAPLPPTSRGAGYRKMPVSQSVTTFFWGEPGRKLLTPSLIYRHDSRVRDKKLGVTVDGREILATHLPGSSGEIQLPPLTPGRHMLKLSATSGTALYLSHAPQPTHVKRYSEQLKPGRALRYRIVRGKDGNSPIILSGRLYAPRNEQGRSILFSRITVEGRPAGLVLPDWTLPTRHFDIRPEKDGESLVLGAGSERVDGGQPFFIPLGPDIPPGSHVVTLHLDSGPSRYLTLGEAVPENVEDRKLFSQEELP